MKIERKQNERGWIALGDVHPEGAVIELADGEPWMVGYLTEDECERRVTRIKDGWSELQPIEAKVKPLAAKCVLED